MASQLIQLNNPNLRQRRVVIEWGYLHDYLQRLLPDFEKVQLSDENLSVNARVICPATGNDRDSMDLYLHVVGFRFQDYRLWNLFAKDDQASASDAPPSNKNSMPRNGLLQGCVEELSRADSGGGSTHDFRR